MSDIYNIVNLKIYLFYFVGLYFYLINLNGGEIIKKEGILILVMFCCFILSLSTVSAIDDVNNSTIVFEQSVVNNSESNDLDIDNSNIVFSPIIGGKTIEITQNNYDDYFYKFDGQIKPDSGLIILKDHYQLMEYM